MSIEIEQSFTVKAPIDAVWSFLTDPRRVAVCLPGATITEQRDDQTYAGTMSIKVGPVMSSYKGKMRFERLDRDAWIAELSASGQDVRGKGGADLLMTSQLTEHGGHTEVTVTSQVTVVGILAQFGRGMIQDVSDQLFRQFTSAMRSELEKSEGSPGPRSDTAPGEAEALDVGSLAVSVAGQALRRLVSRPAFWVGATVLVLAIYLIWLR